MKENMRGLIATRVLDNFGFQEASAMRGLYRLNMDIKNVDIVKIPLGFLRHKLGPFFGAVQFVATYDLEAKLRAENRRILREAKKLQQNQS